MKNVGDLTGRDIGGSQVVICLHESVVHGMITELSFNSITVSNLLDEKDVVSVTADIALGDIYLEDVPLDTPCLLERRSDPQTDTGTPEQN